MDIIYEVLERLSFVGVSVLSLLFIMLQATWPIDDKPVPWYYPVNGLVIWGLFMWWVWS